jgi:hypothetical protein
MWFRTLFEALSTRSPRTPARLRQRSPEGGRHSRSFRPHLDVLEDRQLLSAYTVNALTDTGAGSGPAGDLRYCITNATSGNDTIAFSVTGTINLETALPQLNTSVAIQGPGAGLLTVERDAASVTDFGIFVVGSAATVQISALTMARGTAHGIANAGTLTLDVCTLSKNVNPIGDGGGVYSTGALTVIDSTISDNAAFGSSYADTFGGGIEVAFGTLTLSNSTISNNDVYGGSVFSEDSWSPWLGQGTWVGANGYGGGLAIWQGTASIDHCTIADNYAAGGYGDPGNQGLGVGGGIVVVSRGQIHDTILADNYADIGLDLCGGFTSLGNNLVGNSGGGTGYAATDVLGIDPQLGPLQDNGGPTQTMALLAGSPAVNAGDNTGAPAYDQRGPGFARIFGGAIDIGAFEAQTPSPPAVVIADVSQLEGNVGTSAAVFTVRLSAASTDSVSVNYTTADGSATLSDNDYQTQSGTVTFAPGETSKTITILVNGDRRGESNETFFVNLTAATNAVIIDGQGVGTIVDDEPRISINDVSKAEGNTGTTQFVFTVSLSAAYDVPVSVNFATVDGTATAGSDYQATSGTLTIPAGQTSGTITVLVNGDRLPEANESFFVNLSGPTNATVADSATVGVIQDDEPQISISDVSKKEGKKGQTITFTFTVTLSAAYDQAVTLSYRTMDGTATTSDSDYLAQIGTITFKPGQTSKTITIVVNGDSKKEADETFYLDLFGNSSNSLFAKNRGVGTILNDD